jgi:hypothetical protein
VRQKSPPLDRSYKKHAPLQTQRLSDFGIALAAFRRLMTPSEETSIDTFVQLVSLHFSGLIAIVRLQKHGFPASRIEKRDERMATDPMSGK